ncbi:hypothetical protein FSP39_001888 [Pinctada imbricata]|uniref:peptidylprolyl isomerase n=1 Tax=Pinctada imbricata TaxID=66713 RepID=A0AA88XVB5_PINIB|nr:hypothetical protein FSP39_001888 [Pinctada imbricata]
MTPLTEPLEVHKCKDGVMFETEELDVQDEEEKAYFKPEDVLQNLYIDDDEDSDDDDDDVLPFTKMRKKMEDITPNKDGGVHKKILQEGSGNVIPPGCIITIHFNGYLELTDEPFDSSRLRNSPHKCRLEGGGLIPGLELAVSTMKKGELARVLIEAEYAYGKLGIPPRIPEDATVMFEVELLDFVEHAGLDDYHLMTEQEKRDVSFQNIVKHYEQCKQEGKQYWNSAQYSKAFQKYKKAAMYLEDCHLANEEEEKQQQAGLLKLYQNMAMCCARMNEWRRCISWSNRALNMDKNNIKSLYNLGKSLHRISEFHRARDVLLRARRMEPNNGSINKELADLEKSVKQHKLIEREMYSKMFPKAGIQTEEDRKRMAQLDAVNQAKEDTAMSCTPEFKRQVQTQLKEFNEDDDQTEWPFPKLNLTIGEIETILETAQDLGLEFKEVGSVSTKGNF